MNGGTVRVWLITLVPVHAAPDYLEFIGSNAFVGGLSEVIISVKE